MITFREAHAASDEKHHLVEQLRVCRLDLQTANFEKDKLNEEINNKSKLNKELEDALQRLDREKRNLEEKLSSLANATSVNGRYTRNSARQRLLLERPTHEAVKRPKLTNPAEGESCTSMTVRD